MLILSLLAVTIPWFITKVFLHTTNHFLAQYLHTSRSFVVSMGISFYTLQIIAYLIDIYRGNTTGQKNILKYALFVTYFPHILQGPIPRYAELNGELFSRKEFPTETQFLRAFAYILQGFFLKLVIANRAGVIVDTVFENLSYGGLYVLIAGILYAVQLYTDFYACVKTAQGISLLFGVKLGENFCRPYLSASIKEFWRRWHISLSLWLRDYVYIPLGGSRRGTLRKSIHILITFAVSGFWHGGTTKYLVWGLLHGGYHIAEDVTANLRIRLKQPLTVVAGSGIFGILSRTATFLLVLVGWILFRAESLYTGIKMLKSLCVNFNPWILFDDSLLKLGLDWKEWNILIVSVVFLFFIEQKQEQGIFMLERILRMHFVYRCIFFLCAISTIMIFGKYGFGFNVQDFIYRGF